MNQQEILIKQLSAWLDRAQAASQGAWCDLMDVIDAVSGENIGTATGNHLASLTPQEAAKLLREIAAQIEEAEAE